VVLGRWRGLADTARPPAPPLPHTAGYCICFTPTTVHVLDRNNGHRKHHNNQPTIGKLYEAIVANQWLELNGTSIYLQKLKIQFLLAIVIKMLVKNFLFGTMAQKLMIDMRKFTRVHFVLEVWSLMPDLGAGLSSACQRFCIDLLANATLFWPPGRSCYWQTACCYAARRYI
jgi:hypothetical protein